MADPDMTFEVADGTWSPVEFQQASPPVYQRAVSVGDDGKVLIKPKLLADLKRFAALWDRNLRDQGFLKAAEASASNGMIPVSRDGPQPRMGWPNLFWARTVSQRGVSA